ncbi:uncharacterized protein MONBRDRAFT_38140 [Monosiga brevicollis MX1]|uniref:protein-tyrosine-phosphatase n=1 Tax=Monosiga brevicollis TaxID=81824 RepID=A9V5X4_MONBE|nr:uncharacterized protein MONBRDRAFT_38140 [Monosiga brevicollis MX1]EDQ87186.1 predicted protein [Monosiga brevicollis MX1]|eukprot:XP_001748129.1 hypothetical protein [Monosiga brevicollis MX1]
MAMPEKIQYVANTFTNIRKLCAQRNQNQGAGFVTDFQALASIGVGNPSTASKAPENIVKNRYVNITAYDASRVVLKDHDTDYINASWCPSYTSPRGFIATQGPVPSSFDDFWWMIWSYKVGEIVMVTRELETNVLKCHRYWPEDNAEVQYGKVKVKFTRSAMHAHHIERHFEVGLASGGPTRDVVQLAFQSWPDHGVPLTSVEFLEFRAEVLKFHERDTKAPICIHCSAGVGRTGTYIAIDTALQQVQERAEVNIDAIIGQLRQHRNFMVQTVAQYAYVHKVVLDALNNWLKKHKDIIDRERERMAAEQARELEKQRQEQLAAAAAAEVQRRTEEAADVKDKEPEADEEVTLAEVQAEQEQMDVEAEEEKKEIEQLFQGAQPRIVVVNPTEIKQAEAEWKADTYDVSYSMTSVESKFESLQSMGVNIQKAAIEQIANLVRQAKELRIRQREAVEAEARAKKEAIAKAEREAAEHQKAQEKAEAKNKAQSRATRYLRKMSMPSE